MSWLVLSDDGERLPLKESACPAVAFSALIGAVPEALVAGAVRLKEISVPFIAIAVTLAAGTVPVELASTGVSCT